MAGILGVTRSVNNHTIYKMKLEELGFTKVTVTALEKDGLNTLICNMKPDLLLMGARFYECSTPYMMGELKRYFPKLKMAALTLETYPPDLAMYFILNGVWSYVSAFEGFDRFYEGLDDMLRGREYISPAVQESIDRRRDYPMPAKQITLRHIDVIRLVCCGFRDYEVAETLHISERTVTTHKTEIFRSLNVRSPNELIRVALQLKIVAENELFFFPKEYTLNPLPDNKILKRRREDL